MNPSNVMLLCASASVILGTLGGLLEHFASPGSRTYRAGALLAGFGTNIASLLKVFGAKSAAAVMPVVVLAMLGFSAALSLSACSAATDAAIVKDDQAIMAPTSLVCGFAEAQPIAQPYVDFVCTGAEALEQTVAKIPVPEAGAADAADGGAEVATSELLGGGQLLVHVPSSRLAAFLAKHSITPAVLASKKATSDVTAAKSVVQAVVAPPPAPASSSAPSSAPSASPILDAGGQ